VRCNEPGRRAAAASVFCSLLRCSRGFPNAQGTCRFEQDGDGFAPDLRHKGDQSHLTTRRPTRDRESHERRLCFHPRPPARGVENPHSSQPIRSRERAVSRVGPWLVAWSLRHAEIELRLSQNQAAQPEEFRSPSHAHACAEPWVGGCIFGDRAWRMNPPPDRGGRARYGAGSAAFPFVVDPTEGPAGASVRAFFPAPEGGGEPSLLSAELQQRYGAGPGGADQMSLGRGMHLYHQFGVDVNHDGGTSGSLPRHSNSPPGFFSSPVVDNGKD
jgi:hypothetical protein